MGYIFDALSKKHGEVAKFDDSGVPGEDLSSAVSGDDREQTGSDLAAVIEAADKLAQAQADDDAQAPLRLSDMQFKPIANNTIDNYIADALPDLPEYKDNQPQTDSQGTTHSQLTYRVEPIAESDIDLDDNQSASTSDFDTAATYSSTRDGASLLGNLWNRITGRYLRDRIDDRLVAITNPASGVSEEYRSIRTSILARHDHQRNLVHTISSATPQEGKTITCVNLGLSFAELRNRKTIVVECDLRLPTFGKLLSCDTDRPGLIDYLRGDATLKDIIQRVEDSTLRIIPAGGRVSDEAVQLLSSTRMTQLIQALRNKFDHVLIDTPPVLQLADAGILGSQSEEVLLVARMRRTPRTLVEEAVTTLTSYNANVSGIIATDNPRSRGRGYGYKYGYGYRYGYGYTAKNDVPLKPRKSKKAA